MSGFSDDELGLDRPITRRDFLDGMAVGVAGAAALGAGLGGVAEAAFGRAGRAPYPPTETGLRGQTNGAMAIGHAARSGKLDVGRVRDLGERYDLIVVGGGVSGLAAAHFYRQAAGRDARILVLEALDDFGGHQRRNEFHVRGTTLLSYGGTVNLDSWSTWNEPALKLMGDIGIDLDALEDREAPDVYGRLGMSPGYFFPKERFGRDRLVVSAPDEELAALLARTPLSARAQADIVRVETSTEDHLAGMSDAEKKRLLASISYREYLQKHVGVGDEAILWYQRVTHSLWGVGVEAVPAGDAWGVGESGFQGLELEPEPYRGIGRTPRMVLRDTGGHYTFPDGNATISRLLISRLIPQVFAPKGDAHTMESIVTARARYGQLDRERSPVRMRLNSVAVDVRHARGPGGPVDVTYVDVRSDRAAKVRGRHVVMACWTGMSSYIVDGLPRRQAEAMRYAPKVPLVYTRVAINDWKAFAGLKVRSIRPFDNLWDSVSLQAHQDFGGYRTPQSPERPIVLQFSMTPNDPDAGLTHAQHRAGRRQLLETSFRDYERSIRDLLARAVGPGGFDPARDIAAITVNRWSHGYAYEYNSLQDPAIFRPDDEQPFSAARERFGNVAIANSDAQAFGYTHAAIDEAYRAVHDLVGGRRPGPAYGTPRAAPA